MDTADFTLAQARAHDRKRWLWPMGFGIILIVAAVALTGWLTGLTPLMFAGPITVYLLVPLLDLAIGKDSTNPPERVLDILEDDPFYRYSTYIYVLVQMALFIGVCTIVGTQDLTGWQWLGFVSTIGMLSGISINTAHELGHKNTVVESWLAKIALAPVAYGHFYVEHNYGHHRRVATPEDPASARMGESFWAFLPRTVVGSVRSAWHIEARRLARRGRPVWSLHNEVLQAWAMTALLWGTLMLVFGLALLPFLIVQAMLGASLLEAVNYAEHYGLLRARRANGRYGRCRPEHSWNNDHIVTNIFLFHLQRHSDHHAHPTRRYQSLRHFDEAPELPTGYAGMIVLAYFPPLWYRVMDPRVLAHYQGDLRRANLQPGARARLLSEYPPPA
ncbi:alkane 1-monooxygenase [Salinisphaera orenii]|uniref:Alkane 1-monooxygenase n=1 Tax=Salinisphaera orenii YIM 95161 TaxID=1051139 RepID=A0A423Q3C6_9GAMM|nr:alkane 1-monooxygenase [Salinisphaera halophila]ROO33008.1 alkane 1-monooxygenase [Salinisphaera halophila YIM 95161]